MIYFSSSLVRMSHTGAPSCVQKWASWRILTFLVCQLIFCHYCDVIISAVASQITSFSTVCSAVCSDAHQTKHQSSAFLAFVRGIHWWPVDSPHKGTVTRKMFPFDDVIMATKSVPRVFRANVQRTCNVTEIKVTEMLLRQKPLSINEENTPVMRKSKDCIYGKWK